MTPLLAMTIVACQPLGPTSAVFDFLATRYDDDGDGVITIDEYDREGGDFTRLDRVPDGVLTAADFEPAGRRVRGLSPAEARRQRALHLLAWYFQDDRANGSVELAELRLAFAAYDATGDGRVGRSEFERSSDTRKAFGRRPAGQWAGLLEVETTDPWERILLGVDRDDDGFLTEIELEEFFVANESDRAWSLGADTSVDFAKPMLGRVAPDFTLPRSDSDDWVTLSDFAGERPVALIFGSYT